MVMQIKLLVVVVVVVVVVVLRYLQKIQVNFANHRKSSQAIGLAQEWKSVGLPAFPALANFGYNLGADQEDRRPGDHNDSQTTQQSVTG